LQTLDFSDEFSIKNQYLINLLVAKPKDLMAQLKKILPDSTLLVALFPSENKKEMQQAMITLKDQKTYLLAFSNTQSIKSWNKSARPLPQTAKDISTNVSTLNLDGFIIDIGDEHRLKVESSVCNSMFIDKDEIMNHREQLRKTIHRIVSGYSEINSFEIQDSETCSARIIFYSNSDIANTVIEISKKFQESDEIHLFAPQGLDLLVGKS